MNGYLWDTMQDVYPATSKEDPLQEYEENKSD